MYDESMAYNDYQIGRLVQRLKAKGDWEQCPVILDEFYEDWMTGELRGFIEVIDGRWGASLEINPWPDLPKDQKRPVSLLLYDLWNDPYCLRSVHEERPDLVKKYMTFLKKQFEAHQALGQHFTRSKFVVLTPKQLEN